MTLGTMQFTAIVLMALLTQKLLLMLYRRGNENAVPLRATRMMAGATATLAVHFTLQLTLGLRQMGVTQSVMVNLALLVPASYLFSVAVLLLQKRGRLSRWDWLAGPLTWTIAMAMLAVAILADGQPLLSATPERRLAEIAGALCYLAMQCYYTWRHTMALQAMHRTLNDYYDRDTDDMLRWMQLSIVGLMLLALMVPFAIFSKAAWLLFLIAIVIYCFIFYLVDSFCYYLTSNAPAQMQEAELNAEEEIMEMQEQTNAGAEAQRGDAEGIEEAVALWISGGGYLQSGITQPIAAAQIGIPKYQLTAWLHHRQGLKYNEWLAQLRLAEAKRLMTEHPEWGMDAIAERCGFGNRSMLHRKFKELEGITPAEYLGHEHNSPDNL